MSHTVPSSPLDRTALEPLLDVASASVFLGISRRQVHRLLERNELPAVRVGERIRFIPDELRAYLEHHREVQAP
jgi:excisionase family DNA binding protein